MNYLSMQLAENDVRRVLRWYSMAESMEKTNVEDFALFDSISRLADLCRMPQSLQVSSDIYTLDDIVLSEEQFDRLERGRRQAD